MSALKRMRTEHAGAKNGGGFWGKRAEAKLKSRRLRRSRDRAIERDAPAHAPYQLPLRPNGRTVTAPDATEGDEAAK